MIEMAEPVYSLRYSNSGEESVKNLISPLVDSPDVTFEDMPEGIRYQWQIIRKAIEIARGNQYDMDIFIEMSVLEVAIYKKLSGRNGLTPLMELFSQAEKVDIFNHKSGKSVMLTAVYLDKSGKQVE